MQDDIRIRVINPNTTRAMTDLVGRSARVVAGPGVLVEAVQPTTGPASIESHYEEALAAVGVLEQVRRGEAEGVDAYVVACFGDPGLDAAREVARGPVLGIAEAAFHAAAMVARRFSVVTSLGRTVGRAHELLERYGYAGACGGVHACEIPVLAIDAPGALARVTAACRAAVEADDVDAVVLGCAGMAAYTRRLSDAVGVPVVDGVAAATTFAAGLVRAGLRTSTRSEYAPPPPKAVPGLLSGFAITPPAPLAAVPR